MVVKSDNLVKSKKTIFYEAGNPARAGLSRHLK
jgi:hypothetical protein